MIFNGLKRGTIQYASDLHLNYRKQHTLNRLIKPLAPYLILAGDINDGVTDASRKYLQNLAKNFDQVIMIPGNHDFYHKIGPNAAALDLKQLERQINNLKVLLNEEHTISEMNLCIWGSTLWSYIPPEYHQHYAKNKSDYKHINSLTPEITNSWHQEAVNWLNQKSKEQTLNRQHNIIDNQIIIVTHHAPLINGTCHNMYLKNRLKWCNHAYCTDLTPLINNLPNTVVAWIFGHTHYNCQFQINGCNRNNNIWFLNHYHNSR